MDIQEQVNDLVNNGRVEEARSLLLHHFKETHARYPQYDGYFDGGRLVRMRKNWYKSGTYAFRKGDIALIRNSTPIPKATKKETTWVDSWTAFSPTKGWNVVLWKEHFSEL